MARYCPVNISNLEEQDFEIIYQVNTWSQLQDNCYEFLKSHYDFERVRYYHSGSANELNTSLNVALRHIEQSCSQNLTYTKDIVGFEMFMIAFYPEIYKRWVLSTKPEDIVSELLSNPERYFWQYDTKFMVKGDFDQLYSRFESLQQQYHSNGGIQVYQTEDRSRKRTRDVFTYADMPADKYFRSNFY